MCNLYNIVIIHKWQNSEAYDLLFTLREYSILQGCEKSGRKHILTLTVYS